MQRIKINTNKMFNSKFVRAYFKLYTDYAKHFKEVSFKKKDFKGSELIYVNGSMQIFLDKKRKMSVYIVPFPFYSEVSKGFMYKDDKKRYNYSYYNLILRNVISQIDHLFNMIHQIICQENLIPTCKRRTRTFVKDVRKIQLEYKSNKIIQKYERPDNVKMFEDFGGVANWKSFEVSKENKKNYLQSLQKGGFKAYHPQAALWNRLRWTGFKGTFTITDLKEKVLGNLNIMSDYSFKAMADTIAEPVIYQSAFRPRKYRFYTMEHYKGLKKAFGRIISDERYKYNKMEKDMRAMIGVQEFEQQSPVRYLGGNLEW